MFTLYDQVRNVPLATFDHFIDAIEEAVKIKGVTVFRLKNSGEKEIIGLRIHPDEVVWRLPRNGETVQLKRRARDNWFYQWKTRILNYLPHQR